VKPASLSEIINNRELVEKYVSKAIHFRIGHAQSVTHLSDDRRTEYIPDPIKWARDCFASNSRVGEIKGVRDYIGEDPQTQTEYSTLVLPTFLLSTRIMNWIGDVNEDQSGARFLAIKFSPPIRIELDIQYRDVTLTDFMSTHYKLDASWYPDKGHLTEHCSAWWDGRVLLAYTEDSAEPDTTFWERAREVLYDSFEDHEKLQLLCLDSTPIEKEFVILVASRERLEQSSEGKDAISLFRHPVEIEQENKVIYPHLIDGEGQVDSYSHLAVLSMYEMLKDLVNYYYESTVTRRCLEEKERQCHTILTRMIDNLLVMRETRFLAIGRRNKLRSSLADSVSQLQRLLADQHRLQYELSGRQSELKSAVGRLSLFRFLRDHFIKNTTMSSSVDRETIASVLQDVDQEMGRHSSFYVQLISAIIGGIIALLGVLLGVCLDRILGP